MRHPPIEVTCLVVKLASRCNMDCRYCYIYRGEDDSWRRMPNVMSEDTVEGLVRTIKSLYSTQTTKPQVVFHGGEPLLFGIRRFVGLVDRIVDAVPSVRLSLQTNGTIYDRRLQRGLRKHRRNLSFSLSVDGFMPENDRHRIGLREESKFNTISDTVSRARKEGLLDNILMVVDVENSPERIFSFMKWASASWFNLLLKDGDYVHLPDGKTTAMSTETGEWLFDLYSLYVAENVSFRIKLFDDISAAIVAASRGLTYGPRSFTPCVMTIDTNGEIKQVDTLRINPNQADCLGGATVQEDSISDVLYSATNIARLATEADIASKCRECRFVGACGGGYIQHRFDPGGYKNPSVYCSDYLYLYERVEALLCR